MEHQIRDNVSIDVPSLEAGLHFYGADFGFKELARPFPTMAVLDGGNLTICMHGKVEGTESSEGSGEKRHYTRHWTPVHLDFHVPSLSDFVEKIRANGGSIEREFKSEGPKPAAFCADPFGNGFCVIAESL
ncbi:VOC family protein [Pelagibacterium limicola]|uniref:VOC family protein n=1 Tax=Pelagibacterium limicola TaxID=2791022 RepID=UPI0018AF92EF|nr:VOC family protein [Pelagibacterium limicola]